MVLGIRILALMLARRLLYPPNHTHNPYVAFTLFYFLWVASVYARFTFVIVTLIASFLPFTSTDAAQTQP